MNATMCILTARSVTYTSALYAKKLTQDNGTSEEVYKHLVSNIIFQWTHITAKAHPEP